VRQQTDDRLSPLKYRRDPHAERRMPPVWQREIMAHFRRGGIAAVCLALGMPAAVWSGAGFAPEGLVAREGERPAVSVRPLQVLRHVERVVFVLDLPPPQNPQNPQSPKKHEKKGAGAKSGASQVQQAKHPAQQPAQLPASEPAQAAQAAQAAHAAHAAQPASGPASGPTANPLQAHDATASQALVPLAASPVVAPASATDIAVRPQPPRGTAHITRLTREQLAQAFAGAEVMRAEGWGGGITWDDRSDGTIIVFRTAGPILTAPSRISRWTGRWHISEDGRFCLHIDWQSRPEDWCRFLTLTEDHLYQPVPDDADAAWTPPAGKSSWRPLRIVRHGAAD
jgi:hypothetical protein